jgi:hypothetical protein
MADVVVRNEGTVVMFTPLTREAKIFIKLKVDAEPYQFMGESLVVEHRFAESLIVGMQDDGLDVEIAA